MSVGGPFGLDYANQKVQQTVRALVLDPRPLPERLEVCVGPLLVGVGGCEKKLPEEILTDFRLIESRLTSLGNTEVTIGEMTEKEAIEIADRILELASSIRYRCHEAFPDIPW